MSVYILTSQMRCRGIGWESKSAKVIELNSCPNEARLRNEIPKTKADSKKKE
jgi:hypothetical protein